MDQYLAPDVSRDRLTREYDKHGSLTIGFDFDGTVHDYYKIGATYEMVRELLRELKEINCVLICWTCYPDEVYVKNFLEKNDIPFDGINTDGVHLPWVTRKPFFNALLDDRSGLQQVYTELKYLVAYVKNKINDKSNQTT